MRWNKDLISAIYGAAININKSWSMNLMGYQFKASCNKGIESFLITQLFSLSHLFKLSQDQQSSGASLLSLRCPEARPRACRRRRTSLPSLVFSFAAPLSVSSLWYVRCPGFGMWLRRVLCAQGASLSGSTYFFWCCGEEDSRFSGGVVGF